MTLPSSSAQRDLGKPVTWSVAAAVLLLALGVAGWLLLPGLRGRPATESDTAQALRQARDALAADDPALAQAYLRQCLETWPLDAEVHFLLARACRRAAGPAGWQVHLSYAAVLEWPAEDIRLESLLMKAQAGGVASVEPALVRALDAEHPEERLIAEALLLGYLQAHRMNDVFRWAGRWMERSPDDPMPYVLRGRAFELARSVQRAIADYRRALELRPAYAEAQLRLADLLTLEGQFQEALAQYQAYLDWRPEDISGLFGSANCHFSLGKADLARADLDKLFVRQPEHAGGFLLRAKLELAEGRPQEALTWLQRAEGLAPREPDVLHNLTLCLRQLGKGEEASKYEGRMQEVRRQMERLEQVRKEIGSRPDNPALRHEAGLLSLALGREADAARWFLSALQLDPDHAPTHGVLADYYERRGDAPRAAEHRRKAGGEQGPNSSPKR